MALLTKGLALCEVMCDNWDNWTAVFAHKVELYFNEKKKVD